MIIKIKNPRELPDEIFRCILLKSEDDAKSYDGYLFISKTPIMILFFVKINDKMLKNE